MYSSYKSIALLATLLFLAITTVSTNGWAQEPQSKLPSKTPAPLRLTVTVTNENRFVTELNRDNFQISVDKVPARIVHFSNEDSPVSVGILFDSSGSIGRLGTKKASADKLSIVQQAMAKFFELSNRSNDYFLIGFNVKPQLLADWTLDTAVIVDKLGELKPGGNTAFYDACYVAIEKLQQGRHPKRALILISDGQDNSSRYSLENLRKVLRETDVLLYSIDLRPAEYAGSSLGLESQGILDELTSTSGGFAFTGKIFRRQRDADEIFETIANELRNQYTIGIDPLNLSPDSKWHKIKLKINLPADAPRKMKNLSARTREGFFLSQ